MSANHDNETRFDGTRFDGAHFDGMHFDSMMRQLHRQSLDQLEPATLSRLRAARRDALASGRPRRGFGWGLASATAAVFALAIGMLAIDASWLRPDTQAPHTRTAAIAPADTSTADGAVTDALLAAEVDAVMASYGEDPDLYLWLAASDEALPSTLER